MILWGDHGWHLGDDRVWGKHTLFEWALRSLYYTGTGMQKGAVSTGVVSSIDIYPTLMELCGVKIPPDIDGKSLVPLLKDPGSKNWDNVAYSYFKRESVFASVITGLQNTIVLPCQPLVYDHNADPYENTNIAEVHPEITNRLLMLLEEGDSVCIQAYLFRE